MTTRTNLRIASNIRRSLILGSLSTIAFAAVTASSASAAPTSGPVTVCNPGVCMTVQGTDTDGDGYSDADEIALGTNPNDAASHPRSIPDVVNTWVDGHGLPFEGGLYEITVMPTETPDGNTIIPEKAFPERGNMIDDLGKLFPDVKVDTGNGFTTMLDFGPATDGNEAPPARTNGMNVTEISSDRWANITNIFGDGKGTQLVVVTIENTAGVTDVLYYINLFGADVTIQCNIASDECETYYTNPEADAVAAPTQEDLDKLVAKPQQNANFGSTGVAPTEVVGDDRIVNVTDGIEPECQTQACTDLANETPADPNLNRTAGGDGVNPDHQPQGPDLP